VKSGVQSNDPVPSVLSVNVAPVGRVEVERAGIVLSGSVALTANVSRIPSLVDCEPMLDRIGSWFPDSAIVTVINSESISSPSVA
jgi:hypothetical protein